MPRDDIGPDVSTYDKSYPTQQKWAWTYIRRGIGLQLDAKSDANMAAARALGVARCGWYWYIASGIDPTLQAQFFIQHSGGADFLVSDCEGATTDEQAHAFNAYVIAAGYPVIEYVQGSRRHGQRGNVSGQIIAAWGLPDLAAGALGWQAWSSDSGTAAPIWVPSPQVGDWDVLQDAAALDTIIAKHKGSAVTTSAPFNLVPITCLRRVLLPATADKPIVLYRQDRTTPYTTLRAPVSLGYIMAADATWAVVADGDAGCYVRRDQMGPITDDAVTVGN